MKKSNVTLDLDEYNELRDFKTNIEEGNTIRVYDYYLSSGYSVHQDTKIDYITKDDSIKEIHGLLNSANKKVKELEEEIKTLNTKRKKWYQKLF